MRLFAVPSRKTLFLAGAALLLCGLGSLVHLFWEDANFRVLTPHAAYRAAQIRGHEWQEIYDKYPFKTVINLRGDGDDAGWYTDELAFSKQHAIQHYDIPLSSDHIPTMDKMEALITLMKTAQNPVLIHCRRGADRSSLASALYLYAIEGQSADQAAKQLSLWYGHAPWLPNGTAAMDEAFARYVAAHL